MSSITPITQTIPLSLTERFIAGIHSLTLLFTLLITNKYKDSFDKSFREFWTGKRVVPVTTETLEPNSTVDKTRVLAREKIFPDEEHEDLKGLESCTAEPVATTKPPLQSIPFEEEKKQRGLVTLGVIELPKHVSQYAQADLAPEQGIGVGCVFYAVEFVLYARDYWLDLLTEYNRRNTKYFTDLKLEMIKNGLTTRRDAFGELYTLMALDELRGIEKYTKFNIPFYNQAQVWGEKDITTELKKALKAPQDKDKISYSIITYDILIVAIAVVRNNEAFMFDSHTTNFSVMNLQQMLDYFKFKTGNEFPNDWSCAMGINTGSFTLPIE